MPKILKYLKLIGWCLLVCTVVPIIFVISILLNGVKHLVDFTKETYKDVVDDMEVILEGAKYTTTEMWKDE